MKSCCHMSCEHSNYDDITSNSFDPILGSRITEDEMLVAAKSMNRKSVLRCGIPSNVKHTHNSTKLCFHIFISKVVDHLHNMFIKEL